MTLPTFQNTDVFVDVTKHYAKCYVDASILFTFMLSFKNRFYFHSYFIVSPIKKCEISKMVKRKKRGPDTTMQMVEMNQSKNQRNHHPWEWVCIFQITVLRQSKTLRC